MVGNIAMDALVGSVPVFGDLFDIYFKSHRRNVDMIIQHFGIPGDELRRSANKPRRWPEKSWRRFWTAVGIYCFLIGGRDCVLQPVHTHCWLSPRRVGSTKILQCWIAAPADGVVPVSPGQPASCALSNPRDGRQNTNRKSGRC